MINFIRKNALNFCWLITLAALLVSLYLSEILQWPICNMCWYQRIFLYPQVILLGMAAFKEDHNILPYTIVLSSIGFLFAIYQYLMQLFPLTFDGLIQCSVGVSCATKHFNWLGFVTLPLLSAATFFLLIILQCIGRRNCLDDTRG